jgi:hypothetical protein
MDFDVKKLENCFADAENYEYRVAVSGTQFSCLLTSEQKAEVRVNERLRRPVFIATLPNGVRVKGELANTIIRVGYGIDAASEQKAAFEDWLSAVHCATC